MNDRTSLSVFMRPCLIWLLLSIAVNFELSAEAFSLDFRAATPADVFFARKTMFQQAMNPLSISQDRLLVAFGGGSGDKLLGFGQIRPLEGVYHELASLYVSPRYRHEGIGGALVQQLLLRHDIRHEQDEEPSQVCLMTLLSTTGFYEPYGFEVMDEDEMESSMPSSFQFEYAAGSAVSSLLGNGLVGMIRRK